MVGKDGVFRRIAGDARRSVQDYIYLRITLFFFSPPTSAVQWF